MERNRRWVVAPRPAIISAVLAMAAIFIIFGAWGMHNWTLLSVGLAILAGGLALLVISAMNSTVRGVAHIIQINTPPAARYRGRVTATAIVRYKSRRGSIRVVLREDDVPLNKWPAVHDELPVVGLSNDLWSAEVLWAQVPTHQRIAARRKRAEAREAAAAAATAAGAAAAATASDAAETAAAATGATATATVTVERPDPDDADVTEVAEAVATAVGVDGPEVEVELDEPGTDDESGRSGWSPPGTGKVVEGVWWDSYGVDGTRLEADITTPDPPPPSERAPGSKPSPRPRRPPEDVIIGITFGATTPDAASDTTESAAPLDAVEGSNIDAAAQDAASVPDASRFGTDSADPLEDAVEIVDLEDPDDLGDLDIALDHRAEPVVGAEPLIPHQSTGSRPRHAAPDDDDPDDGESAYIAQPDSHAADSDARMDPDAPTTAVPADPLRTSPLNVLRAGILAPGIPAPRTDNEPYDLAYDHDAVALAYRDALPPPGTPSPRRADVTVTMFVRNLSRSIIFYRDVLGFTEIDAARRSAVLDLRDVRVILKVVDALQPSSKNVQFSLEVDDLEVAYEDLRARGVKFVHRPRRVEHYEQLEHFAAPFEDPDGHRISLSSWRSIYGPDE